MAEQEEQSPRFDKKMKGYLLGTFGAVTLLFFLMFISEKLTQKPTAESSSEPPTSNTAEARPTDLTGNAFTKVQDKRQNAPDTYDATKQAEQSKDSPTMLGLLPSMDALAKEKQQQEALEYKRAALAYRSGWNVVDQAAERKPDALEAQLPTSLSSPEPETLSTDEQRQLIAKRLHEMAVLKQQIQSGNYNAVESQSKTQALTSLEQSFTPPPPEIVGFTEENVYNASTEGLLKLPIGTLIPAITMTKANTDNTGTFKALVSQDIFDTTNEYVLIPKGAEVILKSVRVSGTNEAINYRMGVTVPWIILPNGTKVDMSKSTGLDREGLAGMSDQVDRHLLTQFMGVAAYALVANETSYEGTGANSDASYVGEFSQGIREQLSPLAQKYLALAPTITIRSGQSMNVIVEDEIYLKPWRHIYEDYL